MPSPVKQSLYEMHPGQLRVPLLILFSATLLALGLSLPLLNVEQMVFWKNEYSVIAGVISLLEQREYLLGFVLFFFSVVFPIVKLVSLAYLWVAPLKAAQRESVLHWLGLLGKWSMLDVFIVAILIVLVKMGPLASIEPRTGVYFFCAAIVASMLSTMAVTRLTQRNTK